MSALKAVAWRNINCAAARASRCVPPKLARIAPPHTRAPPRNTPLRALGRRRRRRASLPRTMPQRIPHPAQRARGRAGAHASGGRREVRRGAAPQSANARESGSKHVRNEPGALAGAFGSALLARRRMHRCDPCGRSNHGPAPMRGRPAVEHESTGAAAHRHVRDLAHVPRADVGIEGCRMVEHPLRRGTCVTMRGTEARPHRTTAHACAAKQHAATGPRPATAAGFAHAHKATADPESGTACQRTGRGACERGPKGGAAQRGATKRQCACALHGACAQRAGRAGGRIVAVPCRKPLPPSP